MATTTSSRSTSSAPSSPVIPTTMRSIVYDHPLGNYTLRTSTPVPTNPNKHKLLVRVHAVGLNPVDAKGVVGDKLNFFGQGFRNWMHRRMVVGHVPGFDFSGTVVESTTRNNKNTQTTYKVGDAVFGTMPPFQGTLAEYIAVPLDQVCHILQPSSQQTADTANLQPTDFQQAAALPLVGLTALQCLQPHLIVTENNNNRRRTSVLVIGASGGTGHVALQVAKALLNALSLEQEDEQQQQADFHITAVCSSRNEALCRDLGATHVIDYHPPTPPNNNHSSNPQQDLLQALREAPGCPFDIVMDCVTSDDPRDTESLHYPSLLQQQHSDDGATPSSSSLLADNYVYRRLGGPSSDWIRASLQRVCAGGAGGTRGSFFWKGLRRKSNEQLFWIRFPQTSDELQQLAQWVQAGKLRVSVDRVFDFSKEGVQQAMGAIMSRRVRGKVVIQIYPPLESPEDVTIEQADVSTPQG